MSCRCFGLYLLILASAAAAEPDAWLQAARQRAARAWAAGQDLERLPAVPLTVDTAALISALGRRHHANPGIDAWLRGRMLQIAEQRGQGGAAAQAILAAPPDFLDPRLLRQSAPGRPDPNIRTVSAGTVIDAAPQVSSDRRYVTVGVNHQSSALAGFTREEIRFSERLAQRSVADEARILALRDRAAALATSRPGSQAAVWNELRARLAQQHPSLPALTAQVARLDRQSAPPDAAVLIRRLEALKEPLRPAAADLDAIDARIASATAAQMHPDQR